jgi:hypothetical protein
MLLAKGQNDLIYSPRPDWWDIGNLSGARVYHTTLMTRALQDYVYILSQLEKQDRSIPYYGQLSERMKSQLVDIFWDDERGFLMSMLDSQSVDSHFFAGSLLAAHFQVLDNQKRAKLLLTAKKELMDEHIGIRNAMPADFHELIDLYKFSGNESGAPYLYFNGGSWSQGNAWYALGLIADNQSEEARKVLEKYLTLEGIQSSPNGQPSFYEYRNTDSQSPAYGEIDKPTFLWAGGWFLYTMYRLAGLRENAMNISFSPQLPIGFDQVEYDLTLFGQLSRVKWSGNGNYFKKILVDGVNSCSAVMTSPCKKIDIERGFPEFPYLAEANCLVKNVSFDPIKRLVHINFIATQGIVSKLLIISPSKLERSELNAIEFPGEVEEFLDAGTFQYLFTLMNHQQKQELALYF